MFSWLQRNWVRLLVVGLLLFSFLVFTARIKEERSLSWLDRALIWVTAPVQHATVWMLDGVSGFFKKLSYQGELLEENRDLKAKVDRLERQLIQLSEAELENLRLKELVQMRERLGDTQEVGARVVGVGTSPASRTIRIDVGREDGVKDGNAVVAGSGLVGRVTGAVAGYAEVQLLIDGRSAVDVVIHRSRARGIVRGQGEDEKCSVDHLVRTADVEVGDQAITSGAGGTYPAGLLVGTITRVTSPSVGVFREADLEPAVNFQLLEEVLVVTGFSVARGAEEEKK